ncbi:PAS domain S-box protein [Synechococcales cyanobacterium C]|uniref:histidine kinase n=1 Tax=Petrachloros mirabilis ULC683 TaxID=2781853 RepID=A0A8K1ZWC9_9CYAN|nr:PAS domain S-box protein [Petrachloros mirabilis]NCJ05078.1 PAS domain S-box protein [Petrachloros mirabilis ULC683]
MTDASSTEPIRHLLVIEDEKGKRTVALEAATCSMGRDSSNTIVLHSSMVSRQHAILLRVSLPETDSYLFRIIDGNLQGKRSTNGLSVNGRQCFYHDLKHGDTLLLGRDVKARYYATANAADVEYLVSCETDDLTGFLSTLRNPYATLSSSGSDLSDANEAALVRLASFPELFANPIIEVNLSGSITYVNPAASAQFPDLRVLRIQHPILTGIVEVVQAGNTKTLTREVETQDRVYEQSVHYIAESDLIRSYIVDITERKRTEAALHESERKFRAIFNQTFQFSGLIRPDGTLIEANQTVLDFGGLQHPDVINRPFWSAPWWQVSPDSPERLKAVLARAAQGHFVRCEIEALGAHQTQATIDLSLKPVLDDQQEVVLLIFEGRDITERKRYEAALQSAHDQLEIRVQERTQELTRANQQLQYEESALRESEERFRWLVEGVKDYAILMLDPTGKVASWNAGAARITGYSAKEVMGLHFSCFHADINCALDPDPTFLAKAQQQGQLEKELWYERKDGARIWVNLVITALQDPRGQLSGFSTLVRDITERKQAEDALRSSYATNRALLNAIPDPMFRISREGVLVNFKMPQQSTFPLDPGPHLSQEIQSIFPAPVAVSLVASVQKVLVTKEMQIVEFQLPFQGQVFEYEARLAVSADNEVMAILRDITERKRAEADVRNALEKEKELNEMKSRFVTMTSHEFRTPLATILSSSELLEHYGHKWGDEKKAHHLHQIQTSVKHMTSMLDDVLLISKSEAGKLGFSPVSMHLTQFFAEIVEELQITTSCHQICLQVHDLCEPVAADPKLLRQILNNLLFNAIKYSPQGGNIYLDLSGNEAHYRFSVKDEGIGIPEVDQQQMFSSFHRASNVGNISGTGLGLAIVKKAVDLHQGQIDFQSTVGVGTTFTIELPARQQI